jgi:predicted restriction endonuclease
VPFKQCLEPGCGELLRLSGPSRCPTHRRDQRKSWSWDRNHAAHKRFARAVKKRDGYRCTFVEDGVRCSATTDLVAHHLVPLAAQGGDDPANGVTVCRAHHRQVDRHAR